MFRDRAGRFRQDGLLPIENAEFVLQPVSEIEILLREHDGELLLPAGQVTHAAPLHLLQDREEIVDPLRDMMRTARQAGKARL